MSSGQEGKDPRCIGCKDYHKSDYDYPCKVCAHIDANMAKDWYEEEKEIVCDCKSPIYPGKWIPVNYGLDQKLRCSHCGEVVEINQKTGQYKTDEEHYLDKLINDHWAYIEALLKAHGNELDAGIAEFHYRTAAKHFWKHCREWMEENKDD